MPSSGVKACWTQIIIIIHVLGYWRCEWQISKQLDEVEVFWHHSFIYSLDKVEVFWHKSFIYSLDEIEVFWHQSFIYPLQASK